MHDHHPTILSTNDYDRLQALMCTMIGARTPLASLLRRKLGSAVVVLPSDRSPDLVTSGRKVRFRAGAGEAEERTLVWEPQRRSRGDGTLSLQDPRGLSLLGLGVGQSISYLTDDRQTEVVEVDYVFPAEDEDVAMPPGLYPYAAGMLDESRVLMSAGQVPVAGLARPFAEGFLGQVPA